MYARSTLLISFLSFLADLLRATYNLKTLDTAYAVECRVAAKRYERQYCWGHKGGADGRLKVKRRPNRDA